MVNHPNRSKKPTPEKIAPVLAWWFASGNRLSHGDGRKIILGKTHTIKGTIVLCENALHGSRHPMDALKYATGPILYRVKHSGTIKEEDEKIGSSARKYLAMRDMTEPLRRYSRAEALGVINLWDAPKLVRIYLETGDESLRAAAWAAARAAARAAAGDAAWDAAGAAARAAAGDAAWAAAWDAAGDAARDAARQRFLALVEAWFSTASEPDG